MPLKKRKSKGKEPATSTEPDWATLDISDPEDPPTSHNGDPDNDVEFTVPEHRVRFTKLKKRNLIPSRFIDLDCIRTLEIESNVRALTERVGLWDFLSNPVPTYRALTYEFLSSFEYSKSEGLVQFQLRGTLYAFTIKQLNEMLGFPFAESEGAYMSTYRGYGTMFTSENDFLESICGYMPSTSKANQISHPALRYIQRVLAHTIFARGETSSTFIRNENFFLFCMLARNNQEPKYQPNIGHFLADRLRHVITVNTAGGVISIGGIITKIALALDINVIDGTDTLVDGTNVVNFNSLIQANLIEQRGVAIYHLTKHRKQIPFPVPPIDPPNIRTWHLADNAETEPSSTQQEQPPAASQPQGDFNQQPIFEYLARMQAETMARIDSHAAIQLERFDAQAAVQLERLDTLTTHQVEMRTEFNARYDTLAAQQMEMRAEFNARYDTLAAQQVELRTECNTMRTEYNARLDTLESQQTQRFDTLQALQTQLQEMCYRDAERNWETYAMHQRIYEYNMEQGNVPSEDLPPFPEQRRRRGESSRRRPPA